MIQLTFQNVCVKLKENMKNEVRDLYPGYFAFVMATGIVSIASYLQGMLSLSMSLFFINKLAYGVFVVPHADSPVPATFLNSLPI